jgi:hypothetical protein
VLEVVSIKATSVVKLPEETLKVLGPGAKRCEYDRVRDRKLGGYRQCKHLTLRSDRLCWQHWDKKKA